MATRKLGAPTGMFDADSNEINVGDILLVADGSEDTAEYTVNKYGHIVSLPYKFCDVRKSRFFRISRKWCDNGEDVTLPSAEETLAAEQEHQKIVDDIFNEPPSANEPNISEVPDIELKRELERRGWQVTATKEVMVPQIVEL